MIKIIKKESGLAYVAVLLLLAIMSTLGLSFLYKAATGTLATMNRREYMQADYLAEAAANHAVWGLLNLPGFAPAADVYYMHSFGNGRYGYKVRKPTETTFATVATVGVMGDSVVNQSYVPYIIASNILTAYGRSAAPIVQYRRLIGSNWGDAAGTPPIPIPTIYWVELEGCPTHKEIIMGTIDGADDIDLAVWDGTAWGNLHTFSQNANKNYKCFDIAYESQSGDALVVGRYDGTTTVRYNIWDGNSWAYATAQPAFTIDGGQLTLVTMASCPGNDDILIATVDTNNNIRIVHWDGNSFHDQGKVMDTPSTTDYGVVEIVYETVAGDALVLWGSYHIGNIRYRVWDGANLGLQNDLPDFGGEVYVLRAAADPTSDHIVVAGIDKFYDLNVAVWDGDAWIDSREIETSVADSAVQSFDVAWEASGEDAVIAWAPWIRTNIRSLAWRQGTALADSTVTEGPDFGQQPWLVRLLPIAGTEKIVLLGEDNSNDLHYCLWTGDRFRGDPAVRLYGDIPVLNDIAFDLAEADVPRTGGTGTGGGG